MKLKISTLLSRVVKIKIPKLCENPLARKWSENNLRLYPIFYSPNLTRSLNMAKHNQNIISEFRSTATEEKEFQSICLYFFD